jgi:hypothetical protein
VLVRDGMLKIHPFPAGSIDIQLAIPRAGPLAPVSASKNSLTEIALCSIGILLFEQMNH